MTLETERLNLRLFIKKDENELIKLLNDESVTKWVHLPFPYTKNMLTGGLKLVQKKNITLL